MCSDLKYKKIERIVGIYKDTLLIANIEIQNNHIKLSFKKVYNSSIKESIENYNLLKYEDKIKLFENYEYCEDKASLEDLIINKIRDFLSNNPKSDLCKEDEKISNVNLYTGDAMPLVIWMCSFANKRIDRSIADIAPTIVNKILEFEEPNLALLNENNVREKYYLYTGDSEKIKFCIGKEVASNFDKQNYKSKQLLIEFKGKGDYPGKSCRFWCLKKNLIKIEL